MIYDLLVIGEEAQGIERALDAARRGARVALVRPETSVPSWDLLEQSALRIAQQFEISMPAWRADYVLRERARRSLEREQLERFGVEQYSATAKFLSPTTVEIADTDSYLILEAREVILACGTTSWIPAHLGAGLPQVVGYEDLLSLAQIPATAIVVGSDRMSAEVGQLLMKLGVETTLINEKGSMSDVCGLLSPSCEQLQQQNVVVRMGDEVVGTRSLPDGTIAVKLASGCQMVAELVVVCAERQGRVEGLNLESVGVGMDERGRIWTSAIGQTWVNSIYVVGSLAAQLQRHISQPVSELRSLFSLHAKRETIKSGELSAHRGQRAVGIRQTDSSRQ